MPSVKATGRPSVTWSAGGWTRKKRGVSSRPTAKPSRRRGREGAGACFGDPANEDPDAGAGVSLDGAGRESLFVGTPFVLFTGELVDGRVLHDLFARDLPGL